MASNTVATAWVEILPEMSGIQGKMSRELGDTADKAGQSAGKSSGGRFSAAFGAAMGAAQAVTQKAMDAISSSIGSAVSRVDTLNNFPRVMQSLGYSADESSAVISGLSDRLSALPTKLDDMASAVQRLAPSSASLTQAKDRALAFNDALLAGGTSADTQKNAMDQLVKSVSTGKMEMDSWMSIQEAMPGQLDQVAKSMLGQSASASDLYQAMQDGKVSVDQFADAIVELDQNGGEGIASFYEQAQNATGGISTSFSNMQNAVTKGVAKVIDAIGAENIAAVADTAKGAINGFFDAVSGGVSSFKEWAAESGAAEKAADLLKGAVEGAKGALEFIRDNGGAVKTALSAVAAGFAAIKVSKGIAEGAKRLKDVGAAVDLAKEALASGNLAGRLRGVSDAIGLLGDGGASGALSSLAGGLGSIAAKAKAAGGGITGLSSALGLGPWGLLAAAIAAVVAGLVYFFTQTETGREMWSSFTEFLGGCWESVKQGASDLASAVGELFTVTIPQAVQGAIDWFTGLPASIGAALSSALAAVAAWASGLAAKALEAGSGFVEGVVQFVTTLPERVGYLLGLVIGAVLGFVVSIIAYGLQAGSEFLANVVEFFTQLPGKVAGFVTQTAQKVAQWAVDMAAKALQAGTQFLGNVVSFFQQLPGRVAAFLSSVISSVASWVTSMVSKALSMGSQFVSSVTGFMSRLPGIVGSALSSAVGAAASGFSGMVRAAASGVSSVISTVSQLPGRVVGALGNVGGLLVNSGASLLRGFVSGIQRGFSSAVSAVKSGLSKIRAFFPFSPAKEGPFSGRGYTTFSGRALMEGMAEGIGEGGGAAEDATRRVMGQLRSSIDATATVAAVDGAGGGQLTAADVCAGVLMALSRMGALRIDADAEGLAAYLAPAMDSALGELDWRCA